MTFTLRSLWTQLTENVPPNILPVTLVERSFKIFSFKNIIHGTFFWNVLVCLTYLNMNTNFRWFREHSKVTKFAKCSILLNITFIQPRKNFFFKSWKFWTLCSFQTCTSFLLLLSTKDILKNVGNQTADGSHWLIEWGKNAMQVSGCRQLFGYQHSLEYL